ncbi:MAG: cytochrome c biogenesis protein ResB [Puniceicoccaceae bacterium]
MKLFFRQLYAVLSSLRLTVYLLGFSLILVFFGTLDQVHFGIYETQRRYFQAVIAFWQYPLEWPGSQVLRWLVLPMPGGYLLGPLFMANLACAHFRYFRPRLRNIGIVLIHGGLGLLLVGQLLTDLAQEDFQMWIDEGSQKNYAESFFNNEIALVDQSDPDVDRVWSIPDDLLKTGAIFQHPELPLSIRIQRFYVNARIMQLQPNQSTGLMQTSQGVASRMRLGVLEAPPTYAHNQRNVTTAVVEILHRGSSLGTWLVSNVFDENLPAQRFEVDGHRFDLSMRFERRYFPFSVHLIEFSHDRYPGTEIPKNFSSLVHVDNHETGETRDTLIYMNHPLRYGGYTFYQASFANEDTSSMLQVVRNPGWLIPYISCVIMSLGLLYQFGWTLVKFAGRMRK